MIDWNDPVMKKMKSAWESQNKPKIMEVKVKLLERYYKRLIDSWGEDKHLPYLPLTFRGSYLIPKI